MRAIILVGGPTRKISVNGKILTFEMHPMCGPILLKRNGDAAAKQPMAFLEAASLWAQQGQRMEGDLCRWDRPGEMITEHIAGKHYKFIGMTEPTKGQ